MAGPKPVFRVQPLRKNCRTRVTNRRGRASRKAGGREKSPAWIAPSGPKGGEARDESHRPHTLGRRRQGECDALHRPAMCVGRQRENPARMSGGASQDHEFWRSHQNRRSIVNLIRLAALALIRCVRMAENPDATEVPTISAANARRARCHAAARGHSASSRRQPRMDYNKSQKAAAFPTNAVMQ
jgi:hypothetical protein